MRASLCLAVALCLGFFLFGQVITECEQISPKERDGCYLGKSKQPEQCANILDPNVRDQCFLAIAEQHAQTYHDCDRLYEQYQPLCYSRLTYAGSKSQLSCENLPSEFRGYCYFYYAEKRSNGQISSCDSIPPQYKQECVGEFFKKNQLKTENDCSVFGERYREDCAKYVGSKNNPITLSLSFIEGAVRFLASQEVVAVVSLLVITAILLFFGRAVFKGMKRERQGLK